MIENDAEGLARLYQTRFAPAEVAAKERVWAILCKDFFSRFVKPTDRVLDVAAGYCEFINNIECAEKYAYDANPDTGRFAGRGVKLIAGDCRDMSALPAAAFDVAFVSNFFEHLASKHEVDVVLRQIFQRLRPGGLLLVLQPNLRYVGIKYWDFFDHTVPLTELSMTEGLVKNGYRIKLMIPKWLPYSFKSKLPTAGWMVRLYLRLPLAWWFLGKQMFVVAERPESDLPGLSG